MNSLLPFIIAGLVSGSVYGLAGTGLVLTYKTSGIFNFAYGGQATIAAYFFYTLRQQHHMAWPAAALICVVLLGVGMGLVLEGFARRLARTPVAQTIAGTVGVLILIQAGATLIYGVDPLQIRPFLPHGPVHVGGVVITVDQFLIVGIGIVVTAALYLFLQRSRSGISMRAIVDNPDLLSLSQFSPNAIRRRAWILGSVLATLSGVLIAPSVSLSPNQLTLLVVQAFGAAAIGQFVSLPRTYIGGLVIGLIADVLTKYVGDNSYLSGLPASIPFIVLFALLVVLPRRAWRIDSLRRISTSSLVTSPAPAMVQAVTAFPLLLLAAVAPLFLKTHLVVWADGLTFVILFASMALLIRVAGQVSLCHVSFAAIGASTFAQLAGKHHLPWFLALLVASLVVVPIGAMLAVPASRLPVLFLGLATFGFGLVVQQMFYATSIMFTPFADGLNVGRPHIGGFSFGSDFRYYYLILVIATVSVGLMIVIVRTRLGRILMSLSDSPLALNALGTDERVTRVLVFCISAFFAGLSGALYAGLLGNVSSTTFDPIASLTYLVVIVIAVGGPLWAAVGAAIGIAVIPGYVESGNISQYLQLAFGAIAIAVAVGPGQPGLPPVIKSFLDRFRRSIDITPAGAPPMVERGERSTKKVPPVGQGQMEVRGLTVVFGGVKAVDDVTLVAKAGTITGLIGPNGAGKTTTFNACSGLVRPTAGNIFFSGAEITAYSTAHRARLGLGRTFQQTSLFPSMTVLDNLLIGREAAIAGASPFSQIIGRQDERAECREAVAYAVELCGISELLDISAADLTTGQRRMVEIARCIAGPAKLLLLDEPSAGLDPAETALLGQTLQRLRADKGLGILLVEHDMDLVMDICDYIYVLDFGRLIFEGDAVSVQGSEVVRHAYLGDPLLAEVVDK